MNTINNWELLQIDLDANDLIKAKRASLGLKTDNNRIDTADLVCIVKALSQNGFVVVKLVDIKDALVKAFEDGVNKTHDSAESYLHSLANPPQ